MIKHFSFSALFFCGSLLLQAQDTTGVDKLHYPQLVSAFYTLIHQQSFWLNNTQSSSLRKGLIHVIDSAAYWALDANDYHNKELHRLAGISFAEINAVNAKRCELVFTDAAISFFKDLYEGSNNKAGYDELSPKDREIDKRIVLNRLIALCNGISFEDIICSLEPATTDYIFLKKEYQQQSAKHDSLNLLQLKRALNYLRWINHFRLTKYIVVNIPSATLNYYQADTVALTMNVVVGRPSIQTPRFAAYCDKIILYPYWNVPASIALNELLPLFKKEPGLLSAMNMQVLDNSGNIVDTSKLNWSAYTKYNFPYRFRQSTGCDNSLGIMKFNLTDPFTVYMHDTNYKPSFHSKSRFYSHGCIRVEKPLMLANLILPAPIDSSFVELCLKDETPVELDLINPVPVFVIYSTVKVDANNNVVYYKDVYNLLKK